MIGPMFASVSTLFTTVGLPNKPGSRRIRRLLPGQGLLPFKHFQTGGVLAGNVDRRGLVNSNRQPEESPAASASRMAWASRANARS